MKNISFIFFIILLCLSTNAFGQSRKKKTSNLILNEQSDKLRQITGWKLDANGNWISNENAISDTKLTELNKYSASQNFKWIQFASFNYSEEILYALLYETSVYVTSENQERRVYFFLIPKDSYKSIKTTIENKRGQTLAIESSVFGYLSENDEAFTAQNLLNKISLAIADKQNAPANIFLINAQHVDDQDVVRFRLPDKNETITDRGLLQSYFECDLMNFNKILLPIKDASSEEFDLGKLAIENFSNSTDNLPERNTKKSIIRNDSVVSVINTSDEIETRKSQTPASVSSPISTLSDIEGWYLTTDDEWVTDNNYNYQFETVGKYDIRKFTYNDKVYWLLTRFEKYAGTSFFLISDEEYIKAVSDIGKNMLIKIPIVAYAGIGNTLTDMIALSEDIIDTNKKEDAIVFKTDYLIIQNKLSKEKNVSRFFIFRQECSKYGSESSRESCNNQVSSKINYRDEEILGTDLLFNKAYYECPYNDFIEFFRKPLELTVKKNNKEIDHIEDFELRH